MSTATPLEPVYDEQHRFRNARLTAIAAFLAHHRAEVIAAAHAIPADGWTERATPEGWSPAEILDHLRIAEHGTVRLLEKLVPEALAAGHPEERETSSVIDAAFVAARLDRSSRIVAPARAMPTRAPDLDSAVEALGAERTQLLAAMHAGDGLAFGSIEWPHPAIGVLSLYEWLVFLGAHEGRHAAQLREIAVAFAPRS